MAKNKEKTKAVHITRKSERKPGSPSIGAILRLKLQCFQTEKRQVVLYETVVLSIARKRGRKAWLSKHDSENKLNLTHKRHEFSRAGG